MRVRWDRREILTEVLVQKREGTRPIGRPRRRWENIKMYLKRT
jgi:hypothetical protein